LAISFRMKVTAGLRALFAVCLFTAVASAAEEEPNEALVQMVVELVSDADRDMRALGLQQIREEVPGEAATKTFADLLPKLSPDAQADLLAALGDRGDPAARDAVLAALNSDNEQVRAAAILAVGSLGGADDVSLLAEKTAADSELEQAAAAGALVRLRGEEVDAALIAALDDTPPTVHAALLGVLARRNAKEALPNVLESASAEEPDVRIAALSALRLLAEKEHAASVADLVKAAKSDAERRRAKLALLAVCTRGKEACVEPVAAAMTDAGPAAKAVLLDALARAGGGAALAKITEAAVSDETDAAVRDEAVRLLAGWPDRQAAEPLEVIVQESDDQRHRIVAYRGLVRLAADSEPADVASLENLLGEAPRQQEKILVVGALGNVATAEALALVRPLIDDGDLSEEAVLAAVSIAEKMEGGPEDAVREAMQAVLAKTDDELTKERAQKVIDSL